jgi:hypothetical protein
MLQGPVKIGPGVGATTEFGWGRIVAAKPNIANRSMPLVCATDPAGSPLIIRKRPCAFCRLAQGRFGGIIPSACSDTIPCSFSARKGFAGARTARPRPSGCGLHPAAAGRPSARLPDYRKPEGYESFVRIPSRFSHRPFLAGNHRHGRLMRKMFKCLSEDAGDDPKFTEKACRIFLTGSDGMALFP